MKTLANRSVNYRQLVVHRFILLIDGSFSDSHSNLFVFDLLDFIGLLVLKVVFFKYTDTFNKPLRNFWKNMSDLVEFELNYFYFEKDLSISTSAVFFSR